MLTKMFLGGGALLIGGLWAGGIIGGPAYSREVARPMAEVAQGLADLDLTQQPGAPGTDPARSGGVPSLFRLEQRGNELRWVVGSGNQVATTMIATLVPIDASHTRVTARVERGDAPDDFVAPAFRSTGITMGLFAMALEDELNDLTKPRQLSREDCAALFERLMLANFGNVAGSRPEDLSSAIAQGARTTMKLHAVAAEARRQGCEPQNPGEAPMREMMAPVPLPSGPDGPGDRPWDPDQPSFKPGAPMVRPTPSRGMPEGR